MTVFFSLFGIAGAVAVVLVLAAGAAFIVEPEDGTVGGAASIVNLSGAAGGKVVRFGSATTPTPTPTPTPTLTPTPTPTPPPSGGCALPNYPDASCTGVPAGTVLSVTTGDMNITTANTVIENKDIRGHIEVCAPGVIIRKSKISYAGTVVLSDHDCYGGGARVLLEDVEIDCKNTDSSGVANFNVTVRRANIHGCGHGVSIDKDGTIEDSYIHDLIPANPGGLHVDGIIIAPPCTGCMSTGITIQHNRIYARLDSSSAVIAPKMQGGEGASNVLVQNNLMAGAAYSMNCPMLGHGTNFRVINNHFSTIFSPSVGYYGPIVECEDEAQDTGNVIHETGQPVT